jgi:hypothetical protein
MFEICLPRLQDNKTIGITDVDTAEDLRREVPGRAAKPLSASSKAIGGYFVKRVIAEYMLRKALSKSNIGQKANKSFEIYSRWRKEGIALGTLAAEYQAFIKHFSELTYRVEEAKLTLFPVYCSLEPRCG